MGHAVADLQTLDALEARDLDLPRGLLIKWLGVSGFRLSYEGASLLIDPYLSQVGLRALTSYATSSSLRSQTR